MPTTQEKPAKSRRQFLAMMMVLAALQVADIATTNSVLMKRTGSEANPLVIYFMNALGDDWYFPKLVATAFAIIFSLMAKRISRLAFTAMWMVIGLYVCFVSNNLLNLR